MDPNILWFVLAAILILVGIAGTVLPALPGVPLVFVGMLVAAWADDFTRVGAPTLIVLGVLTALTIVIDVVASLLGAKKVGASRHALIGAAIGTVVGLFFGLPGLLLGPFAGALLGELLAGGTLRRATGVGVGTWLGFIFGTVVKIGLCFAMLGIFVFALLVD